MSDFEIHESPKTWIDIPVTLYNSRGGYESKAIVKDCCDGYLPPIIIWKGKHYCCLQSEHNKYRRTFTAEAGE